MKVDIMELHGIKGLENPYWYQGSFTTDLLPNIGESFVDEETIYKIIDKKYKLYSPKAFGGRTMECDLIVKKVKQ